MRRSSAVFTFVIALLVAGCQQAESQSGAIPESATVPLLQPHSPYAPERDDPPKLVQALVRQQREGFALLKKARTARADEAGGCVYTRPTLAGPAPPKEWLPRPPKISARMLGHQVEVDVELQGNPTSLVCRPMGLTLVVSTDSTSIGGISDYRLFGPGVRTAPRRFRVLGQLPYNAVAPYKIVVSIENLVGRRSPYVERPLACPPAGCLAGPTVEAHVVKTPPTLPLRGITTGSLERSVSAAFSFDQNTLRFGASTCAGSACTVPFVDPLRSAHGTASYAIQGEQVEGCWLGRLTGSKTDPARAESPIPQSIGGCVSWR